MAQRDDADAPWLAEVESDGHASTLVSRGRFIGGVTMFVLLLLLIVIGIYVITTTKQDGATGTPVTRAEDAPLITADPGPNKVRPADKGGSPTDQGSIYGVSKGNDEKGTLDPATMPEEPGPRPGAAPVPLLPGDETLRAIPPAPVVAAPNQVPPPAVAPSSRSKAGATAAVPVIKSAPVVAPIRPPAASSLVPAVPTTVGGGTVLQLGAFSSAGKAEQAWKSLSSRFAYLAPLSKRIEAVERDSGTLYRLRASGSADPAEAARACAMLKVAGEACVVVK